jgi:Domain of unknown function (DUF4394)/PEP-CTERM motif
MPLFTRPLLCAAALAACVVAPAAQAATVYSLASGGSQLIRFDSASPGTVTTVGAITGAGSLGLDGLDFRPANGLLYGYSHQTGSVYTVNTGTGAATLVTAISAPTNTNVLGIDFNPVPDRLRIVTDSEQNLRVNVAGGATTVDGALAYAAGDPNFGVNPGIIDAAYTNSDTNAATGTTLYYIDYRTDTLVSTTSPNAGVLNTVGALGFDTNVNVGFDIFTDLGVNTAYATLNVGAANGFYGINLATGAATLLGAVGDTTALYGLAVVPGRNAVPEPGSLALVGLAGLAAWGARRRAVQRLGR